MQLSVIASSLVDTGRGGQARGAEHARLLGWRRQHGCSHAEGGVTAGLFAALQDPAGPQPPPPPPPHPAHQPGYVISCWKTCSQQEARWWWVFAPACNGLCHLDRPSAQSAATPRNCRCWQCLTAWVLAWLQCGTLCSTTAAGGPHLPGRVFAAAAPRRRLRFVPAGSNAQADSGRHPHTPPHLLLCLCHRHPVHPCHSHVQA